MNGKALITHVAEDGRVHGLEEHLRGTVERAGNEREDRLMQARRHVVVDVETTGMSVARGGRVIEVGAVVIEEGRIVAELGTLIEVDAPIAAGAYRVHGSSPDMLLGKPTPAEVWPRFLEFVADAPLVAHNASFDSTFIRHELARLGKRFSNRWHCTVSRSRQALPHLPNHRLETVYRHLFGSLPGGAQTHRALDDARLTARVWVAIEEGIE
ncbi:MAG: DNA polymerase III subunit [Geobacteraceae bacterium]|nr:MAG: DNA polymerase III subunit [Geobacteraceae bacterium]